MAANQDTMEFKRPSIGLGGSSGEESLDNTGTSQKDVRKTMTPEWRFTAIFSPLVPTTQQDDYILTLLSVNQVTSAGNG